MKLDLNKKIQITSFIIAFLIMLIIFINLGIHFKNLIDDNKKVQQSLLVQAKLDRTLALLNEAETSQRGFIITGKQEYLDRYESVVFSESNISQHMKDLQELTSDKNNQQLRLAALELLVEEKLSFIEKTIDLRKNEGFLDTQKLILTDTGEDIMFEIKQVIADMQTEEKTILQNRTAEALESLKRTIIIVILGSGLSSILIILSYYFINREIKIRRRVEEKLNIYNIELEKRVEQRSLELNAASQKFISAVDNMTEGCQILGKDWKYIYINDSAAEHSRCSREELIGQKFMDMWPGIEETEVFEKIKQCLENNITHQMENKFLFPDGSEGYFRLSLQPIPEGVFILSVDITERILAELHVQQLNRLYATLSNINKTVVRVKEENELFDEICSTAIKYGKFALAWIGLLNIETGDVIPTVVNSGNLYSKLPEIINLRKPPFMDGLMGQALRKNQAVSSQDVQNDPHMQHWNSFALEGVIKSATAIPFRLYGKIYGFLNLYASDINFFLGDEEMNLLDEMSLGISFALDTFENEKQRVHAENEIVRQLQRIHSLRKIDLAILGNNNIHQYLRVVLKQLESMLEIDAADLFLFDDDTKLFKYIAGYGFLTKHNETSNLLIGQDIAGKAAIGQKMKYIPNLQEFGEELKDSNLVNEENFIEYYAVPLNNNGNVSGVLEIFNRKRRNFVKNELDFLMSLSEQVAIAIEKYQLLTKLQIALDELTSAYDRTIEGWSNALDLRDKETEGHTIRVTQMTLELARYAGFSESDLIHIKRGALLHDIGKMGIPDHILLKPGKLTDEEWEMMRKHPQFAYDLLSPITYLQPALDIPYYHHEKWDGSGYPKGLKGEQIPLAARLFSIIDVWDALTSDRPYRPARSKDETLRYIQSMSGSHFDPYVVKIFMEKKVYEIEIEI